MTLSAPRDSRRFSDTIGRELLILVCALAFGFLASPPLLWVIGEHTLGAYADGGVQALAQNFFRGLGSGTYGYWVVGFAPYGIVLLVRGLIAMARAGPEP